MNYLSLSDLLMKQWNRIPSSKKLEYIHLGLNRLISSTLNFYVLDKTSKAKLLFSKENIRNLKISKNILKRFSNLINLFKEICKKDVRYAGNIVYFRNFLHSLVEFNKSLREYLELFDTEEVSIKSKEYDENLYRERNIKEVQFFSREINKIYGLREVFIHGSLATLDYTDFSDFDTFIVLNKELENDIDLLLKVSQDLLDLSVYFYRFDPYQHHRYFFVFEGDLNIYNNLILPIEVLNYACSLKKSINKINVYYSDISSIETFIGALNKLIYFSKNNFSNIKNIWDFKYFLSTIYFLPVLFLETQNIFVYKKYSFDLIKDFLSENLINFLDGASKLREVWNKDLNKKEKAIRKIFLDISKNPVLYEDAMRKFSKDFNKENFSNLLEGSLYYINYFYKRAVNNKIIMGRIFEYSE